MTEPDERSASSRATLTVLISDLEDSTWLWEHHPEVMDQVVQAHAELVAESVGDRGHVVKSTGDGMLVVFDDAAAAVDAAVLVQQATRSRTWPGIGRVQVRIGLNTGRCRLTDDDVVGPAPNLAARLQSVGHGGQILLSDSTARASRTQLGDGQWLRTLGPHLVRSYDDPIVIHTVAAPGLPDRFPPLRTAISRHDRLPPDDPELFGRDRLLVELHELLVERRLVTVWGPAGVGKSRIAVRVAATASRPFHDGVRYVDLSPVTRDDDVAEVIAASVASPRLDGESSVAAICRSLGVNRVLVVIDNCEHVLATLSSLIATVMAACPGTHFVISSREPIGLSAELPIEVEALPIPRPDADTMDELHACPSVEVFLAAAAASQPGFRLTPETAPIVITVCRAADGLPFALQLAGARIGIEGLDGDIDVVAQTLSDGPLERSLAKTLGSLDARASALFTRLSMFEGSFDRRQVEQMATTPVAAALDRLVRTAVVQKDVAHRGRFRMLAPFRSIGRRRIAPDERLEITEQHAALMLDRAIEHAASMRGADEAAAVAALGSELADHRAVIEWRLSRGAVGPAARHVNVLFQFCLFQPEPEGHRWIRRLAELATAEDSWAAETLGAAALAAWYAGNTSKAITLGRRSIDIATDHAGERWAQIALVDAYSFAGDLESAFPHYISLIRNAREDEPFWQVHGLGFEAIGMALTGRYDAALALVERAIALAQEVGNADCRQWAFHALGRTLSPNDPAAAVAAFESSMRFAGSVGSRFHLGLNLIEWVALKRRLGEHDVAVRGAGDLLSLLAVSGNRAQLSQTLREVALLLVVTGRVEAAAVALAGREGLPSMPLGPTEADDGRTMLTRLRSELGSRWSGVWVRAKALSEAELIAFCRRHLRELELELRPATVHADAPARREDRASDLEAAVDRAG